MAAPRGSGRGRGTSARDTYRPLPSLSNLSNASLHAVMSSCESVIFASRRRTACAVELPESCRNVFLYVNFLFRLVLRHGLPSSLDVPVDHRVRSRAHDDHELTHDKRKISLPSIEADASASLLTARSVDSKKDGGLPLHSLGWWIPPPRKHARARGALSAPARRSPPTRHRIQHQTTPFNRTARKLGLTPFPRPFPAADGRFLPDRVSRIPPKFDVAGEVFKGTSTSRDASLRSNRWSAFSATRSTNSLPTSWRMNTT